LFEMPKKMLKEFSTLPNTNNNSSLISVEKSVSPYELTLMILSQLANVCSHDVVDSESFSFASKFFLDISSQTWQSSCSLLSQLIQFIQKALKENNPSLVEKFSQLLLFGLKILVAQLITICYFEIKPSSSGLYQIEKESPAPKKVDFGKIK
jgi:hypothetical protein